MKLIQILILSLLFASKAITQNYFPGDTLNVVAINGLNLRETPSSKSTIITMLDNGEKIVILKSDQQIEDRSDGFQGYWVKILSLSSNQVGFVFDAYISHYPVLKNFESIKVYESGKYRWGDDEMFNFLPAMLNEYAVKVFKATGCQLFYSTGSDGEGAFSVSIAQLDDKVTLIKHGYTEGHGIELELSNARVSEIYYLIKNILKFVPNEILNLDDESIKLQQEFGQKCIKIGEHSCIIRIRAKNNNIISILFNNACC